MMVRIDDALLGINDRLVDECSPCGGTRRRCSHGQELYQPSRHDALGSVGAHQVISPATCLVAALSRFQTLMFAIARIRVASAVSSKWRAASS